MGRELRLDTAQGHHVANEQMGEISPHELAMFSELERRYTAGALDTKVRVEATPRYNCHGMTFAGRRTGVWDVAVVLQILREDRYREIARQAVLPGDVLLYFDDSGDAEHSAIVLDPPSMQNLYVPLVISKWGRYKELIHRANNCPYNFTQAKYYRIGHD